MKKDIGQGADNHRTGTNIIIVKNTNEKYLQKYLDSKLDDVSKRNEHLIVHRKGSKAVVLMSSSNYKKFKALSL